MNLNLLRPSKLVPTGDLKVSYCLNGIGNDVYCICGVIKGDTILPSLITHISMPKIFQRPVYSIDKFKCPAGTDIENNKNVSH